MTVYVPHTASDEASMLADLGLSSIDQLFEVIPDVYRLASGQLNSSSGSIFVDAKENRQGLDLLDTSFSEPDIVELLERVASKNLSQLVCFAGGGSYDHDIASVVRRLGFRTEFVTAYTPYQPEVSQGILQALFEYQTVVSRLFGTPLTNASLYDGATALVEAINMAASTKDNRSVMISKGVNPRWREVVRTLCDGTEVDINEVDLSNGLVDLSHLQPDVGVVVVSSPNYLGNVEDLEAISRFCKSADLTLIVTTDPVAAALMKPAGDYAEIVVGEGQPFGTPLSFGGPYIGLIGVQNDLTRKLPGRLVGQTCDVNGTVSYVTTLRAREQDIRREKATSNICTNQTLIAVAFLLQTVWLGTSGIREVALQCGRGTRYLRDGLKRLNGVELGSCASSFREFSYSTPLSSAKFIDQMMNENILAGIALEEEYDNSGQSILTTVTEKRTRRQIDDYIAAVERILK